MVSLNVNEKITRPRLIIKGDFVINTNKIEELNSKRIIIV